MKGIILDHKDDGVQVMDKKGYFHYVHGYANLPIGFEIEIPEEAELNEDPLGAEKE